jgi:hypothetical protein
MSTTFQFPYAEYYQACNRLFSTPPVMAHLFKVKFKVEDSKFPAFTAGDEYDLTYFAEGATTPTLSMGVITRKFQGVEMRLPGLSDYGEKSIEIKMFDTQDRFLYNAIRNWQKAVVDFDFASSSLGRVDLSKVNIMDRMIVQAMSTNGSTAPSWCCYGLVPTKVTDVQGLNQDELSNILSFTVTFKYRFAGFSVVTAASQTSE